MTSSDDVRQAPGGTAGASPEEIEPIGAEQRWRLVLGLDAQGRRTPLSRQQAGMDQALRTLYDEEARSALQGRRARGGLGESSPRVARWLGDIRTYFPTRVVQVMQVDALERFGLTSMLLEPEVLEMVEPDIHLAATLASLSQAVPEQSKATARAVVAKVARQVEERLADNLQQAVRGALDRATRTSRPALADINWGRTITANLKNYVPELGTVIPERIIGYGRRHRGIQREFTICLDQSGSMATSVVRLHPGRRHVHDPLAAHHAGGLRHGGHRPDAPAHGPGGRHLRHPARRGHGHHARPGVLPADDYQARGLGPHPH